MTSIREKIPSWGQLAPVYSIIVLFIYPWTIIPFFWKLPSWLYYLPIGKIFVIYAYAASVNFIESLLILFGFIFLSVVFPKKLLYEHFISRSSMMAILGLSYLMYFDKQMTNIDEFPRSMVNWIPLVLVGILILTYILDQIKPVRKFIESLADRTTVFLYIAIPFSVLSLAIVLFRNIF